MTSEPSVRARRVGRSIRDQVAVMVTRVLKDPGTAGAGVTRVEMSDDLRSARVHVRLLQEGVDAPARRRKLLAALNRAAGLIRSEVGRNLRLRHAPDLRFLYDDGTDQVARIEALLREIAAERKAP